MAGLIYHPHQNRYSTTQVRFDDKCIFIDSVLILYTRSLFFEGKKTPIIMNGGMQATAAQPPPVENSRTEDDKKRPHEDSNNESSVDFAAEASSDSKKPRLAEEAVVVIQELHEGGEALIDTSVDITTNKVQESNPAAATKAQQETKTGESNAPSNELSDMPAIPLETPTNDSKKGAKPSKRQKKKLVDPKVLEIRRRIQLACRDNDLAAAMEAYDEAIANSIQFEAQSYYSVLNLCAGFQKRSTIHVGTPKQKKDKKQNTQGKDSPALTSSIEKDAAQENETDAAHKVIPFFDLESRLEYALKIRDRMREQNLPMNDTAYAAILKLLSKRRQFQDAEELLKEAETVQQCKTKLRLFTPLLVAYCEANMMLDGLRIWKRMRNQDPPLDLTEVEYLAFMKCAIATADSVVFEKALSELAEIVAVPSKDTVAAIIEWFELTHSQHTESLTERTADSATVARYLEDIAKTDQSEPALSMGPVVNTDRWQISSACHVDPKTGTLTEGCLKGFKLKQVPLTDRAFREMSNMNETIMFDGKMAGDDRPFQGGGKGKKRHDFDPKQRKMEWQKFAQFLDRKEKELGTSKPFDVVIDGANIGYFGQNFAEAPPHVDYEQIDWVVRHFSEETNQRVLLVMHSRHFSPNLLPDKFRPLVDSWIEEGILYKTPHAMNDDWFWMHAALKYRLLVVSNDEMRDHHFQMLSPRFFVRWRERYHIRFSFGAWETKQREDGQPGRRKQRQVLLEYPEIYSRRIQRIEDGLVIPLAKRGDGNRFLDGSHFANEDEPKEETYLCIRPKQGEKGEKSKAV
jgi:pentatricopeptide repeat protein